jgi:hypothetical protein
MHFYSGSPMHFLSGVDSRDMLRELMDKDEAADIAGRKRAASALRAAA